MAHLGNWRVEAAFGKVWSDSYIQNHVDLDGTGDQVTAPNNARLNLTGKIEMRGWMAADDWTPASELALVAMWDTGQKAYKASLTTDGKIKFYWSSDGTSEASLTCTDALGFTNGAPGHWALAFDPADGSIAFYSSSAGYHEAPAKLSDWTALTNPAAIGATTVNSGTSTMIVGASFAGQVFDIQVWNGHQASSGTLAANPRFWDVAQFAIGQTSATTSNDAQSNTWTLVADAVIAGSWTDLTTDMRMLQFKRGRLYESDQYETGTAMIELNNRARNYEPEHTGGAYSPNVKPWVPIRLRCETGGYSVPAWTGFVEAWDLIYADVGLDALARLKCSDVFRMFNRLNIRNYEAEVTDDTPIGWWKLQETTGTTATDAGSLGVNGTYQGDTAPTLNQTGPITGMVAVNFDDAQNQEVDVGTFTGSNVAADFTVEAWINADGTDSTDVQCLVQIDVDATQTFGMFINRAQSSPDYVIGFQAPVAGSGWQGDNAFDLPFAADTWTHVVIAVDYSAKTATPYVNGVAGSTLVLDAWDQTRTTGTMTVKIAEGGSLTNFDGLMAQVAIYDSMLTAGRIIAHYEAAAASFAAETYDTRISNILTQIGWGGGSDLRAGNSTLTAITDTNSSVIAAIRRAATSEDGEVYVGRDGRIIGRDRHARGELQQASNFTFSENFQAIELSEDDTLIYNQAKITTTAGTVERAFDATSKTTFGPREFSRSSMDISATDAEAMAAFVISRYKDEATRAERISFRPDLSQTLWNEVRDRDIGDLVTVSAEPLPKTGSAISKQVFIEAITVRATPEDTQVRFQCSPAARQAYWVLDSATNSQLNETTKVAY